VTRREMRSVSIPADLQFEICWEGKVLSTPLSGGVKRPRSHHFLTESAYTPNWARYSPWNRFRMQPTGSRAVRDPTPVSATWCLQAATPRSNLVPSTALGS